MADVLFWLLGILAVAAGVAVFRVDSMARATYALAVSFVAVGALLLLLDLDYLGAITVLMMMMEMAIMGVFMLMYMMGPAGFMPMSMVHSKRTALGLSLSTFVLLATGSLLIPWPPRRGSPPPDVTRALGEAIMGSKMLVMLTVSPLLFATMVAAITLSSSRSRYDEEQA